MKILATFAHPDDESYGPAGTLAQASQKGHIVHLLTLTHGESGSIGISKTLSATELAKRRHQELHCAANKLGIQQVQIHNLSDKQLKDMSEKQGIKLIKREINRFKPDIIITFHENTISGHPDHLAVTNWALNAVQSFPDQPKLLYYGLDQEQTSMVTFRKLISISSTEFTHRINVADFISNKIAAIRCHKTQDAFLYQFEENKIDFKTFAKWEVFVQKYPQPEYKTIKCDLFK